MPPEMGAWQPERLRYGATAKVVARYAKLNVPTYWCGINSELNAKFDAAGNVTAVSIGYPWDYVKQQLGYAGLYGVQ